MTNDDLMRTLAAAALALALGPAGPARADDDPRTFTIAVIPDTQNYVDFRHQTEAGFPFDARDMFLEQMQFIADNVVGQGGEIVFATSVGDLWQHQTLLIDPAHEAQGYVRAPNAFWDGLLAPDLRALTEEIPTVLAGYRLIAGRIPFSVAPGNHDYDATWTDVALASAEGVVPRTAGTLHTGGLSNYVAAFSEESEFFSGQPWYVASHDHGADSAQVFEAGGYRFLHIGLQFDAPDASLAWAASVIARYPALPTIVTTHNYLDIEGGRTRDPIVDNAALDPLANTPEQVWAEFISQHDQIFLVLCGHRQVARRTDTNRYGHEVYQLMSNYQGRGQTAKAAGADAEIGDGWLRLMMFDFSRDVPAVRVRTYSTYYDAFSTDLPDYATWYRSADQAQISDAQFHDRDEFTLELTDFRDRFGGPRLAAE